MIKFIHLDYRIPRNKDERRCYALSEVERHYANIFINVRKNKASNDLADTFFHEMAHVFFAFHGQKNQMSSAEEEKLAQKVGRICAGVLK